MDKEKRSIRRSADGPSDPGRRDPRDRGSDGRTDRDDSQTAPEGTSGDRGGGGPLDRRETGSPEPLQLVRRQPSFRPREGTEPLADGIEVEVSFTSIAPKAAEATVETLERLNAGEISLTTAINNLPPNARATLDNLLRTYGRVPQEVIRSARKALIFKNMLSDDPQISLIGIKLSQAEDAISTTDETESGLSPEISRMAKEIVEAKRAENLRRKKELEKKAADLSRLKSIEDEEGELP